MSKNGEKLHASRSWLPICPREPLPVSSLASPLSAMNILKRTPETSIRCLRDSLPLSALLQCLYHSTSVEGLSFLFTPLPSPQPRVSYFFVQIREFSTNRLVYRGATARLRIILSTNRAVSTQSFAVRNRSKF